MRPSSLKEGTTVEDEASSGVGMLKVNVAVGKHNRCSSELTRKLGKLAQPFAGYAHAPYMCRKNV